MLGQGLAMELFDFLFKIQKEIEFVTWTMVKEIELYQF